MSERTTRRVPRRRFVGIPEVARAAGVSRVAVFYAVKSGKLRAYRVPGRREWHVPVSAAQDYIDARLAKRAS